MKSSLLLGGILGVLLLFSSVHSSAITLRFDSPWQEVLVGSPASVGLVISGLGDGEPPSLGTFDLGISFEPTILDFTSVEFGDPVRGDQLDLWGLGSDIDFDDSNSGVVNLFELSLDLPGDLNTLQAGSFTLANLTFDTLSVAVSPLNITVYALGDAWGDPLAVDLESASISSVPEPATILLLGSGLAVLFGLGRKRRLKS